MSVADGGSRAIVPESKLLYSDPGIHDVIIRGRKRGFLGLPHDVLRRTLQLNR